MQDSRSGVSYESLMIKELKCKSASFEIKSERRENREREYLGNCMKGNNNDVDVQF